MTPEMSYESKQEVVRRMRWRYKGRGRQGRSALIEQLCELCGYERKYAIKLLNGQAEGKRAGARRGGAQTALWRRRAGGSQGDLAGGRTALWQAAQRSSQAVVATLRKGEGRSCTCGAAAARGGAAAFTHFNFAGPIGHSCAPARPCRRRRGWHGGDGGLQIAANRPVRRRSTAR